MAFDEQYIFIHSYIDAVMSREKRCVAIKALTGYSTDLALRSIT
jgi:hypothetical protein